MGSAERIDWDQKCPHCGAQMEMSVGYCDHGDWGCSSCGLAGPPNVLAALSVRQTLAARWRHRVYQKRSVWVERYRTMSMGIGMREAYRKLTAELTVLIEDLEASDG